MVVAVLLASCVLFAMAYRWYGRMLSKACGVDDTRLTPAHTQQDGIDYVPTRLGILFGHHFSAIAGAGAIVGPILAATSFGLAPTWLWVLFGAIFVGGVHDFGSIFVSVRNRGRSIADATRHLVGPQTARLFIFFLVVALNYLMVVTLDLTANTFRDTPAVATASGWFCVVALVLGYVVRRFKTGFRINFFVFVPLTFLGLWVGHQLALPGLSKEFWIGVLLVYCFAAATLPVNMLLQPRDFLSAKFLVAMLGLGLVGLLFSDIVVQAPLFTGFFSETSSPGYLLPALFITVACGACSGFHSVVSSGTTSKQIYTERDIRPIGYGSMLVEGVLAVFSLACVAIFLPENVQGQDPVAVFANGAAYFLSSLGISMDYGREFIALTVSTFLLTTLDCCTRLCRFLVEELFHSSSAASRYLYTVLVLIVPGCLVFCQVEGKPIWQVVWPLFGATNQLMAALALVTFAVFLKNEGVKRYRFVLIPMVIMLLMPVSALGLMVFDSHLSWLLRGVSAGMLVLGVFVAGMSLKALRQPVDKKRVFTPEKKAA
jgi:carbon starvation protein